MTTSSRPRPLPPMAPSVDAWARMSNEERARVVEELPARMTEEEMRPPEGDPHLSAKVDALETLRMFFEKSHRTIYVAAELAVYYPGAPRFAPDLLAVRDVAVHPRMKWVVGAEGKGLDWVLEVHVAGDARKDLEENVRRYARLGIPEYFIFDRGGRRLHGYRLPNAEARSYVPIVPQTGFYSSEQLGLELVLEGDRLRFYHASAELLAPRDLADKLRRMVQEAQERAEVRVREEQGRVREEQARVLVEQGRVREEQARVVEEKGRAERAEATVEKLRAEIDELRRR